jgi:hypothetical protein
LSIGSDIAGTLVVRFAVQALALNAANPDSRRFFLLHPFVARQPVNIGQEQMCSVEIWFGCEYLLGKSICGNGRIGLALGLWKDGFSTHPIGWAHGAGATGCALSGRRGVALHPEADPTVTERIRLTEMGAALDGGGAG